MIFSIIFRRYPKKLKAVFPFNKYIPFTSAIANNVRIWLELKGELATGIRTYNILTPCRRGSREKVDRFTTKRAPKVQAPASNFLMSPFPGF